MKLLIVGQVAQATGIARMVHGIANGQSQDNETHILGIDHYHNSDLAVLSDNTILHRNSNTHELFAESRLTSLLDEIRPDVVLIYCDPWFMHRFQDVFKNTNHKCITIGYIPIDGEILQPSIIKEMQYMDQLVLFTKFGYKVIWDNAKLLGIENTKPFQSMDIIPHGISKQDFYPLFDSLSNYRNRRIMSRKALFPKKPELWDGFWVLNANRNQYRKRIDLTLLGFSLFAKNKPNNVRLYLHMELKGMVDVLKMAKMLNIQERLIFNTESENHPTIPTSRLNVLYNACDVGVNTAQGEGWGLISCEHAATGAPQIVPNYSACSELWHDASEMLTIKKTTCHNGILKGGEISVYDLANSLEKLYENTQHYDRLLIGGYQKMMDKAYTWKEISNQWNSVLQRHTASAMATLN